MNAVTKVSEWNSKLREKGAEAAKGLLSAVVDGLKNLPSKMLEIGGNIVKGLWQGIQNIIGWFKDKIHNFFSGIVDGVKDTLDIHSPSKKFAWIGKMCIEGFEDPFDDYDPYTPFNDAVNANIGTMQANMTGNSGDYYGCFGDVTVDAFERAGFTFRANNRELGRFVRGVSMGIVEIYYQNSAGKRLYLDRGAYKMLAKSSSWDYEWNYSTNNYNGRPQMSIRRKSTKRNISVVVSAGTVTECMQKLSELSDFFDIDVVTRTAGRIYVGSGYLKCYVIKSTKSGKYVQTRKTTVTFDVLPDGEDWIYEFEYTFQPQEASGSGNNMDYPHDYPFDYYNGLPSRILLNEAISDADFEMVVYGPCENPGDSDRQPQVPCELPAGDRGISCH